MIDAITTQSYIEPNVILNQSYIEPKVTVNQDISGDLSLLVTLAYNKQPIIFSYSSLPGRLWNDLHQMQHPVVSLPQVQHPGYLPHH